MNLFNNTLDDEHMKIISCLRKSDNWITDETIERKTNMNKKDVRRILYHLNEMGITKSRKEKDQESGWFTFMWLLVPDGVKKMIEKQYYHDINILKGKIAELKYNDLYECKKCKTDFVLFEDAMPVQFRCKSCNGMMSVIDKSKKTYDINNEIRLLEKSLKSI